MKQHKIWNIEVTDRKSFEKFIELLLSDYEKNKEDWENNTLPLFLEAMGSYAADLDGYYKHMKNGVNADIPTWNVFADILRGATMYE